LHEHPEDDPLQEQKQRQDRPPRGRAEVSGPLAAGDREQAAHAGCSPFPAVARANSSSSEGASRRSSRRATPAPAAARKMASRTALSSTTPSASASARCVSSTGATAPTPATARNISV